jgi:hypothetical protein
VTRILTPFWLVAALASGCLVLVEHIAPRTNDMAEKTMQKLMHTSAAKLIEGRQVLTSRRRVLLYVRMCANKVLHNVMILRAHTSGAFASVSPATFPRCIIAKQAQEVNPANPNSWILEGTGDAPLPRDRHLQ